MRLGFFLSAGMSLEIAERIKATDRYRSILSNLLRLYDEIYLFTCDTRSEWSDKLPPHVTLFSYRRLAKYPKLAIVFYPLVFKREILQCDALYFHFVNNAFSGVLCRYLLGRRFMVSATWPWSEFYFRGGRYFRGLVGRFLEFLIFNSASVITVGTREIQENIERVLWGRKEIMPRTNYVNCELFSAKTDYALGNPARLIFIGRLEEQKNPFLLLESLKRLQRSRAVELTMVGEGSLKNRILQFAEENQLNVKLLGLVSYESIPGLLKASDIFVLPSRYEGTPKAVLEAMSCGVPIVGTNVIGLASFLGEGRGLVCSPHVSDLCEKLSLLIDDCEMRQRIGAKARAYVLRYHTAELVMEQELEALKQVPGPAGA